jgi:hypothetical protein
MKSCIPTIFAGTVLVAVLVLPLSGNAAPKAAVANAALRVGCEDADAGAEVYINDKFKGECPVDVMLPEGSYKVRVIKKTDSTHERSFEQDLRLAESTAKKIQVVLGSSHLNAEGRRLSEKATRERRTEMENALRELIRAAKTGDATASESLSKRYIADAKGCLVWNPYPQSEETITWSGPCRDGMASGTGELQWYRAGIKDSNYNGDMVAGKYDGKGISIDSKGRYEGDFVAGKRTGYGTMAYLNGNRYTGEWLDGAGSGNGKVTYPNGSSYEGGWLNGTMEGYGVYIWNTGERYEGDFVAGKRSGHGVATYPDGTREEGQYLNDVFKG